MLGGSDVSRYYHTCPECGANLDPGEKCDCKGDIYGAFNGDTNPSGDMLCDMRNDISCLVPGLLRYHYKVCQVVAEMIADSQEKHGV